MGFNPGTCKNEKRGNFTIIKDRTGNDRIVVCIKNENKFQWSMLNGKILYFRSSFQLGGDLRLREGFNLIKCFNSNDAVT